MAMYQSALVAIRGAAFQRVELASDLIANAVSLGYAELAAELQVTASLPRVETSSGELIRGFREFETNSEMKIVFVRGFLIITQPPQMRTKILNRAKIRSK